MRTQRVILRGLVPWFAVFSLGAGGQAAAAAGA